MLRIHDVMTGFDGLYLAGLPFYSDRALILPGTAVVIDGDIDDYLAYLRDVGIGASRVYRVLSEHIVRTVRSDLFVRQMIRDHVADGGKVQFFSTTAYEHDLIDSCWLGWDAVFNPPASVAKRANCKSELRRIARTLDLLHHFPVHRMIRCDDTALRAAVAAIRRVDCDFVVLKRPDLASGDGMKLVPRNADQLSGWVDSYVAKHGGHEVIVEAGFHHDPMSLQWEVRDDGPTVMCATLQMIDATFEHSGNVIAPEGLPGIGPGDVSAMEAASRPFIERLHREGYRGVCGFDFMRTKPGRLYLLECNGRVTASTYGYGVAMQVKDRLPSWAVIVSKARVGPRIRSDRGLFRRLGKRLFDGERGALPFNTRLIHAERPQCALCCVGRDVFEATAILRDAKRRLEGRIGRENDLDM